MKPEQSYSEEQLQKLMITSCGGEGEVEVEEPGDLPHVADTWVMT